jgi:hypothetical protein
MDWFVGDAIACLLKGIEDEGRGGDTIMLDFTYIIVERRSLLDETFTTKTGHGQDEDTRVWNMLEIQKY